MDVCFWSTHHRSHGGTWEVGGPSGGPSNLTFPYSPAFSVAVEESTIEECMCLTVLLFLPNVSSFSSLCCCSLYLPSAPARTACPLPPALTVLP